VVRTRPKDRFEKKDSLWQLEPPRGETLPLVSSIHENQRQQKALSESLAVPLQFKCPSILLLEIAMIQNDRWIRQLGARIIEPFEPSLVTQGKISFGVSSFGYDFRLSEEFRFFQPPGDVLSIDPKDVQERLFETVRSADCLIPPHSFALARSLEFFRIPRNVLGLCTGKSTYSRCGVLVNITPLEPEWEGHITFPIYNSTPFPVRIYPGEGIAQVMFLEGAAPEVSYADRKGKYQSQTNVTLAKIQC